MRGPAQAAVAIDLHLVHGARVIEQRIRAFVERLSPELVCDRCAGERLGIDDDEAVTNTIHALAGGHGFERAAGPCSLCGDPHLGIRKR